MALLAGSMVVASPCSSALRGFGYLYGRTESMDCVNGASRAVAPGKTQPVCPEGGHMRVLYLMPVFVVDRRGR